MDFIVTGADGRFTVEPVTGELRTHGRAPYTCPEDEPFKVKYANLSSTM